MPKNQANAKKDDDFLKGLGANERALLERIPVLFLRKLAATIVRAKMRVQFTGWLQYLLPIPFMLVLFLIAGTASLLGGTRVANIFAFVGLLLLVVFTFDLITSKFQLRFPERLSKRKDDLDIFDLMRSRRSCRSFQTRKLTTAHRNELMEYVRLHSEATKIGKAPVRFEYLSASLTVWPVVNATEFLVAIAPSEYDRLAVIDVGRSLQKIVMDATRMGLGTCWIGPGADQSSIVRYLGDRFNPKEDHMICVCAIGYKSGYIPMLVRIMNRQLYGRLPLSSLFFTDPHFKEPLNVEAYPFNRFGRNYEICQWSPSSYNGQTTRGVAVVEQNGVEKGERDEDESRLARLDFYAATASRYYAAVAVGIWYSNWEMGCEVLGIQGRFSVLSAEERCVQDEKALSQFPRYDVSWVLDVC